MSIPFESIMKRIIIESIDMVKCCMSKEYISISNCCYCMLNEIDVNDDNYIYCKYKV